MSVAYQNLRHSIYLFSPVTLPFFVKSSHFYLKRHTRKESSIWIKSFVCKSTTNCHRYLKIISLCKKVAALLCRRFACWGVCKDKWILGYTDFRTSPVNSDNGISLFHHPRLHGRFYIPAIPWRLSKEHKNIIHIYEVVLFLFSNTVFYNFYSDLYSTLLTSDKACHKSSLTTLPYLFSFKYFFIPVIKSSSPSQLLIIRRTEAPYNINTEITIIYVILKSKQYRIIVSRVSTL